MILLSQQVFVGDFDYYHKFMTINAEVLFNKIAMRPGSVTTVAVAEAANIYSVYLVIRRHVYWF